MFGCFVGRPSPAIAEMVLAQGLREIIAAES